MDGIIIFADNRVFERDSFENQLFDKLRSELSLSVLPICSIECLEKTIKTVSTFNALILDWNFERDDDDDDLDGVELSAQTPQSFLENIELYSLIYVYSQNEIGEETKRSLKARFPNKIQFKTKNTDNIDADVESIKQDIKNFEENNQHMEIPFIWSQAINQSVQKIFGELEQADPNWIREIRDTVRHDEGDPTSEVINIFHNILNESLIQDVQLRKALNEYSCDEQRAAEENTAKLYRRLYYSYVYDSSPIMTGDIFRFNDEEYGILITPECEIDNKEDMCLAFLIFNKNEMDNYLQKNNTYNRGNDVYVNLKEKRREKLREIYNNESLSIHILPSFPYDGEEYNKSACISFKTGFTIKKKEEYNDKRTHYKLNAPYIHQLRQRYVSFFGKYGVPAIPNSLRDFNLK